MSYGNRDVPPPVTGMALLAFAVIGFALLRSCYACSEDHGAAVKSAKQYVQDLGIEGKVFCQDVDSDHDGYVSCTVSKSDGTLLALDCAGSTTFNTGCRVSIARVRAR